MKKSVFILCLVIFIGNSHLYAQENKKEALTEYEKIQLAKAIEIVLKYHVVSIEKNSQCLIIKRDLIQELIRDGLLKRESSILTSICTDGSL